MLVELGNVMIPDLAWQTIFLAAFLRLEHKLVFGFGCCRHFDFSLLNNLWIFFPQMAVTYSLICMILNVFGPSKAGGQGHSFFLSFSRKGNPTLNFGLLVLQNSFTFLDSLRWFWNSKYSTVQYSACRRESKVSYSIKVAVGRRRDGELLREAPSLGDLQGPSDSRQRGKDQVGFVFLSWVSHFRPGTGMVGPGIFSEAFQPWPRKADKTFFSFSSI